MKRSLYILAIMLFAVNSNAQNFSVSGTMQVDPTFKANQNLFHQNLQNCNKFSFKYPHPMIKDFIAEKSILGRAADGKCMTVETTPSSETLGKTDMIKCSLSHDSVEKLTYANNKLMNNLDANNVVKFNSNDSPSKLLLSVMDKDCSIVANGVETRNGDMVVDGKVLKPGESMKTEHGTITNTSK